MNISALAHDGEQERAAYRAARVVGVRLADDQQPVAALRDLQLLARDARERLERRPGRRAAARAVAVAGVLECVRHRVTDRAAVAASGELHHAVSVDRPRAALGPRSIGREWP